MEEFGNKIGKVSLTFPVQTGKDDKLFGSVTSKDIAEGLEEQGFEIDRRKIQLSQPLKELGTFSVPIKLHRDVVPEVSIAIVKKGEIEGEGASEPQQSGDSGEEEGGGVVDTAEELKAGDEE